MKFFGRKVFQEIFRKNIFQSNSKIFVFVFMLSDGIFKFQCAKFMIFKVEFMQSDGNLTSQAKEVNWVHAVRCEFQVWN
jgi:hypothetical protein